MEATKPYSNLFIEPRKPKEPMKMWEKIVLAGVIIYIIASLI